jgi:hypothetical protein
MTDVQGDTVADDKMANVQGDTPHSGRRGRSGTLIAHGQAESPIVQEEDFNIPSQR